MRLEGNIWHATVCHPCLPKINRLICIGNQSMAWLNSIVSDPRPFFLYLAPHAPHGPATPAPWYAEGMQIVETPDLQLSVCTTVFRAVRTFPSSSIFKLRILFSR